MITKYTRSLYYCLVSLLVFSGSVFSGSIVPEFNDADAAFDITALSDNDDGVNAPDNTTGMVTFAAQFSLDASDIANSKEGPVVVFENGGTSNGNGIYLSDGKFVFFIKNASRYGAPTGLNDTDLTDGVALLNLAPAIAGDYSAYVSYNSIDGLVVSKINDIVKVFNVTVPASSNIDGNLTITFLGLTPGGDVPNDGSLGGMIEYEGDEANENFNPLWDWHYCKNVSEQAGSIRAQLFFDALGTEKFPSNPSPADGAVFVDPAKVTSLSFDAGKDPANPAVTNPDITGHFITVYETYDGEPNLLEPVLLETFVAAGTDPIVVPYTFDLDDVVCWQSEEQISGAAKGSASNIIGPLWTFDALPTIPVVTESPEDTLGYVGETVVLDCVINSKSEASISWYKQGSETALSDADPDISIETSAVDGLYTSILSIANFEAADQGEYYCSVTNASGDDISDNAQLGLKRLLAHWPLDSLTIDASFNYYEDVAGVYNADPNVDPAPEQFKEGVDIDKTVNSLDLTVDGQAAASAGGWAPSQHTGEVSVCAWVYWEGAETWQGIVSNRISTGGTESNFWIEIRPDGFLQMGGPNFTDVVADPLPTEQWVHLAVTAGADGVVIYYDGIPVVTSTTAVSIQQLEIDLNIGALDRDEANSFASTFNGRLDEVKVFSYALSHKEVVDDYYPVSEVPVCVNLDDVSLIMDTNDDCEVNVLDFISFASDWFNTEMYPPSESN